MSFELKFLCGDMFPCEESKTVSVCPYPEICPYPGKRDHPSFVNISLTLVIDTSMEISSRVLQHRNPRIWFSFKKNVGIEFWLLFWLLKCWNHLNFVNVSPTLVIGTWLDRFSRALLHGNPPKNYSLFKKCLP